MELQAVENYEIFVFKKKILVLAWKIGQKMIRLVYQVIILEGVAVVPKTRW